MRVLVLVHMLMLVKLGPEERHRAQRRPCGPRRRPPTSLRALNQEAVVQLLPQKIMLCKKGERRGKRRERGEMGKTREGKEKKRHGRPVSFHNSGRKKRKRVVTWLSLFLQFKV